MINWHDTKFLDEKGYMPKDIKTKYGKCKCIVALKTGGNQDYYVVDVDTYDELHSEWTIFQGRVVAFIPLGDLEVDFNVNGIPTGLSLPRSL